jgi:hypothetical protein
VPAAIASSPIAAEAEAETELHLSVDVGMRNLGIFAVRVDPRTWQWQRVVMLATFDVCEGVESGGKKFTSRVASNAVELLDALTAMHGAQRLFIEEQFIATGPRVRMMNNEARHVEFALLGYFFARRASWGERDMRVHRVPSALKLRGCPAELRKNKPRYKEWTRLQAVRLLRERGCELAASVVERAGKGDDAGDAVKQYVEAAEEVRADETKYAW